MAAYLYQWTHLPTGKYYIGSRTAYGCHVDDGYICSSTIIHDEIVENPQDWSRVILATGLANDILHLEQVILNQLDAATDILSLNQTNFKGVIIFKSLHNGRRTEPLKNNIKNIPSLKIPIK
jgi:hypothetical protein